MTTGRSPFTGTDEDELLWNICNEKVYYPKYLSQEVVDVMSLLLDRNPETRLMAPTSYVGDIATQSFFAKVDWEMVDKMKMRPPHRPEVVSVRLASKNECMT